MSFRRASGGRGRSPARSRSRGRRRLPCDPALDALGDGLEAEPMCELDERRGRSRPSGRRGRRRGGTSRRSSPGRAGSVRIAATDDARPRSSSESRIPRSRSRFTTKRSSSEPAPGPDGTISSVSRRGSTSRALEELSEPVDQLGVVDQPVRDVDSDVEVVAERIPFLETRGARRPPRRASASERAASARRAG